MSVYEFVSPKFSVFRRKVPVLDFPWTRKATNNSAALNHHDKQKLEAEDPRIFLNTASTFCWILRSANLLKSLSFSTAEFWCPCTSESLSASTIQPHSMAYTQSQSYLPMKNAKIFLSKLAFCEPLSVSLCIFYSKSTKVQKKNSENCHFYLVI